MSFFGCGFSLPAACLSSCSAVWSLFLLSCLQLSSLSISCPLEQTSKGPGRFSRIMPQILHSLFESLCLLQKSSLNRYIYYISHAITLLTALNLVLGPEGLWPSFMAGIVRILLLMTVPVELLGLPSFTGFFIACSVFVTVTILSAAMTTHARYTGEEGAGLKVKLLRFCLGSLGERGDKMG